MRSILWGILGLLIFAACDSDIVASETRTLGSSWSQHDVVEFVIPQMDTLKKFNIFFNIRNSNEYSYNNIFIIASIKFPHGKVVTDTLEYRMAASDGTWLGTGIGSVKESKLWYKENISFTETGNYVLSISQAVRNNGEVGGVSELEGILDIGYSIEETTAQ